MTPAGKTRFDSKPGVGLAKVIVTVSSSTTVTSVISFWPPAAKPLYAERSGLSRSSRFSLTSSALSVVPSSKVADGVEVERQLGLVFVVLEVRHEVGDDLAVLVEDEQRVVDALEEHPLAAAVAQGVVAERGLVGVQADDELRRVDGAAARGASAAGTGAGAEREG